MMEIATKDRFRKKNKVLELQRKVVNARVNEVIENFVYIFVRPSFYAMSLQWQYKNFI